MQKRLHLSVMFKLKVFVQVSVELELQNAWAGVVRRENLSSLKKVKR